MSDSILTTDQVADLLEVSTQRVVTLRRSHLARAERGSSATGGYLFSREAVLTYKEARDAKAQQRLKNAIASGRWFNLDSVAAMFETTPDRIIALFKSIKADPIQYIGGPVRICKRSSVEALDAHLSARRCNPRVQRIMRQAREARARELAMLEMKR